MKKIALIMAAGEGLRAGGDVPKQFHPLLGVPMVWWSVRAFHTQDPETEICVVMHPGFFNDWDIMLRELPEDDRLIPVRLICGGRTRTESVKNGLMHVKPDEDTYIAIHDAARPMVTPALIGRCWKEAEKSGASFAGIPEVNSLRKYQSGISVPVERKDYIAVQTPQTFRASIIKDAYAKAESLPAGHAFTDDASLVQEFGYIPTLTEGLSRNIKVTNPEDFAIAETLLEDGPEAR